MPDLARCQPKWPNIAVHCHYAQDETQTYNMSSETAVARRILSTHRNDTPMAKSFCFSLVLQIRMLLATHCQDIVHVYPRHADLFR